MLYFIHLEYAVYLLYWRWSRFINTYSSCSADLCRSHHVSPARTGSPQAGQWFGSSAESGSSPVPSQTGHSTSYCWWTPGTARTWMILSPLHPEHSMSISLTLIALVNWIEAKTLHRQELCTAVLAKCERLPKFNDNKLCSLSWTLCVIVPDSRGIAKVPACRFAPTPRIFYTFGFCGRSIRRNQIPLIF